MPIFSLSKLSNNNAMGSSLKGYAPSSDGDGQNTQFVNKRMTIDVGYDIPKKNQAEKQYKNMKASGTWKYNL